MLGTGSDATDRWSGPRGEEVLYGNEHAAGEARPTRRHRRFLRSASTTCATGAATPAHSAGADLKDIQEMLGHPSITITADTCTRLLPEADLAIAEAAARLVPRARPAGQGAPAKASKGAELGAEGAAPVPDRADPSAGIPEPAGTSARAPLTQTAPDEESGAE
ncbi:hypothetical protein [Streptomyces sp. NPDC054961]